MPFDDDFPIKKYIGGNDKALGRQMSAGIIDAMSFERKVMTLADGSTAYYETLGGMPRVRIKKARGESAESAPFPAGLSARIEGGSSPFVLTVGVAGAMPLAVGRISPRQLVGENVGYDMYQHTGGVASKKGDGWHVFWFSALKMIAENLLGWSLVKSAVIAEAIDGEWLVPFSYAESQSMTVNRWASATKVDGVVVMTVPTRQVYLLAGHRPYTLLPPAVGRMGQSVHQCCDTQTFVDRKDAGNNSGGVTTDLTKYYRTVIWNQGSGSSVDGALNLSLPLAVSGWSNADGNSLTDAYPCVSYRVWALNLDETGQALPPEEWTTRVMSGVGGTPIHPSIRGDFANTWSCPAQRGRFATTILNGQPVDVVYVNNTAYSWSDTQVGQWAHIGQPYLFSSEFGYPPGNPGFAILGREREDCVFSSPESLDASAGIEVGGVFYEFFSAEGSSSFEGSKHREVAMEGFHQGALPEDQVYLGDGKTFTQVIESLSNHSVGEMMGWEDNGALRTHEISKRNDESDLITRVNYASRQRHYLVVDVSLGFVAYLKFSMEFTIMENSADVDSEWKWKIPRWAKKVPVFCGISLCVEHGNYSHETLLGSDTLEIRPPVQVKNYSNVYYLTDLIWGGPRAWAITANNADITYKYKLPSFEPQPSYFNSVDLFLQSQQTNPHIAGFYPGELSCVDGALFDNVIVSRKFKISDLQADAMFANYGINAPLSNGPEEVDPAKTRIYGYSDVLYNLIYQKEINLEYDAVRRENIWVNDFKDNEAIHPGSDSSALSATCFRV